MHIHYFDDEFNPDVKHTYTFYNQTNLTDASQNRKFYPNETRTLDASPNFVMGQTYTLDIYAYYLDGHIKDNCNENDTYYIIVNNYER
jgi:hypothetical protein